MSSEHDVIDQLAEYFGWLDPQPDQQRVVSMEPPQDRYRRSRLVAVGALLTAAATLLVVVMVNRPGPQDHPTLATPSTDPRTSTPESTAPQSTSTSPTTTSPTVSTVASGLVITEAIFPVDLIADSPQYANVVHRGLKAAMRSCMAAAGFDYRMAPDDPWALKPHILDETYRQAYGYGDLPSPPVDGAYESWLQAQDSVPGFHAALYGSDPNAQMGGCETTAYFRIYAPDGVAVAPRNSEFLTANNQWDMSTRTSPAIADDPALAAAANDWSACMSQHGITAPTPDELAITMTKQRPINTPASPQEIATALTDWTCEQSTDFVNRWYGTFQQLTRQFASDHAELISSIQAWKDAVAARSELAIDAVK